MQFIRSLLNTKFLVNALVVMAVLLFLFHMLPVILQITHTQGDVHALAYVMAFTSGVVNSLYQPAIILALAKLIDLKGKNA